MPPGAGLPMQQLVGRRVRRRHALHQRLGRAGRGWTCTRMVTSAGSVLGEGPRSCRSDPRLVLTQPTPPPRRCAMRSCRRTRPRAATRAAPGGGTPGRTRAGDCGSYSSSSACRGAGSNAVTTSLVARSVGASYCPAHAMRTWEPTILRLDAPVTVVRGSADGRPRSGSGDAHRGRAAEGGGEKRTSSETRWPGSTHRGGRDVEVGVRVRAPAVLQPQSSTTRLGVPPQVALGDDDKRLRYGASTL